MKIQHKIMWNYWTQIPLCPHHGHKKSPVWSKFPTVLMTRTFNIEFNNSNCLPLSLCIRVCVHEEWCLNTKCKCCISIRKKKTHPPTITLATIRIRIITLPTIKLPSLHIILTDLYLFTLDIPLIMEPINGASLTKPQHSDCEPMQGNMSTTEMDWGGCRLSRGSLAQWKGLHLKA